MQLKCYLLFFLIFLILQLSRISISSIKSLVPKGLLPISGIYDNFTCGFIIKFNFSSDQNVINGKNRRAGHCKDFFHELVK